MGSIGQFVAQILETSAVGYAGMSASLLLERHPEIARRYDPDGFTGWKSQLQQWLLDLSAAVGADEPKLFASRMLWTRKAFLARQTPLEDLQAALGALRDTLRERLPEDSADAAVFAVDRALEAVSDPGAVEAGIFIDLWSSAARYDPSKASETTFVAMLSRRRLIDRLRKSKREPAMNELSAAVDFRQTDSKPDIAVTDEAARAARLIRTLKPEQQQVIKLAVYEGYTHQSIADALQLPLGTVKTHLRRGLLKVRETMHAADAAAEEGS